MTATSSSLYIQPRKPRLTGVCLSSQQPPVQSRGLGPTSWVYGRSTPTHSGPLLGSVQELLPHSTRQGEPPSRGSHEEGEAVLTLLFPTSAAERWREQGRPREIFTAADRDTTGPGMSHKTRKVTACCPPVHPLNA